MRPVRPRKNRRLPLRHASGVRPVAADETIRRVPPTVLGFLLLLTVLLAAVFFIAAQVVQTP